MFSVELKVNGRLVGHIYGKSIQPDMEDMTCYRYEYYEPEDSILKAGVVAHCRVENADGLRKLISIILEDVDKKIKKG